MAITRRQFVTRLGALAAAVGLSQSQISALTEAIAYQKAGTFDWGTASKKPTVVWVHGAECTGCSTSLLSLFEDVRGIAVEGTAITTAAALDLAVGGNGDYTELLANYRTFDDKSLNVDAAGALDASGNPTEGVYVANIQDVLVDFIQLDYHETVMNMGGDLAAQWLKDCIDNIPASKPFVLVVEGAIQAKDQGGAWGDVDASGNAPLHVPWCSIGMAADSSFEHSFDDVVAELSKKAALVIPIGQCACFGGYPGCKSPLDSDSAGFDTSMSQTGAKGTYDFLYDFGAGSDERAAAAKVVNVPGCPTNPWWFILTVVAALADIESGALGIFGDGLSINAAVVDSTRRLKLAYPTSIHGPYCPRFNDWSIGRFAAKPGDAGCLQKIGCKGPAVKSLCGMHGWNAQQPENSTDWEYGLAEANPAAGGNRGGHCTRAGHPCMGCTEKGYPDAFVPFVTW